MIFSLLYISSVSPKLTLQDIPSILEHAKANNIKHGISGFLLFKSGSFIQLLEGNQQDVMQTYQRIRADARHNHAIILLKENIEKRNFSDYHSAFNTFDDTYAFDKFQEYIETMTDLLATKDSQSLKVIQGIIKKM